MRIKINEMIVKFKKNIYVSFYLNGVESKVGFQNNRYISYSFQKRT